MMTRIRLDADFFERVVATFGAHRRLVLSVPKNLASQNQPVGSQTATLVRKPSFTGCGHAVRLSAYRETRGYVPRAVAYGLEETDLSFQLFSKNWKFTNRVSCASFTIPELSITFFLRSPSAPWRMLHFLRFTYPILFWGWGALQLANVVVLYQMGRGRYLARVGTCSWDCYAYRRYRCPLPAK